MEEYRGCDKKPVIAGSSVHNTRVERMHRDVKQQVVEPFKEIFLNMEQKGLLDRENWVDICLHFVFLPRINRELEQFKVGHNHHPLRTENNKSPLELFITNQHLIGQYEQGIVDFIQPGLSVQELQLCDLPYVSLNTMQCPISNVEMNLLKEKVDPLSDCDDPVNIYLKVTEFVKDCLLK